MADKEKKWSVDWRTFNWKEVDKEIEEKQPKSEEEITTISRDMFIEYLHWLNETSPELLDIALAKGENQRLKLLYLLDILNTYTDDEHALSMAELVSKLDACGVNAERKALYTDIEELRKYGADIPQTTEKCQTGSAPAGSA